jgi:predicted dehydrogenase
MGKGLNVMVEKPAGVYTKQVREMNAVAEKNPGLIFGMMFNQRTNHIYRKMKELVASGKYGQIRRTNWLITNWYRPQRYYDSGAWRATWAGEGGGVLLNQCPHQLDLWQWICGMPARVFARCPVAKYHNIEVEDEALILGEYDNGLTAVFQTTTGEYPGTNRLEITGDGGKMVLEDGRLKLWRLESRERDVCFTSREGFAQIPMTYEEFTFPSVENAHGAVLQNFADHIRTGAPLLSDGREALNEVMLCNAAYLSAWQGGTVALPFDEAAFDRELAARREGSTVKDDVSAPMHDGYQTRWQVRW